VQLSLTAKQLRRSAATHEKQTRLARRNLKQARRRQREASNTFVSFPSHARARALQAIEQGDYARAHENATTCVRQHADADACVKLANRMDALVDALRRAQCTHEVVASLARINAALAANMHNTRAVATVVDLFERHADNLHITDLQLHESLAAATNTRPSHATLGAEVDEYIAQVADEHTLEISHRLHLSSANSALNSSQSMPFAIFRKIHPPAFLLLHPLP
jgi:hypothetical protein